MSNNSLHIGDYGTIIKALIKNDSLEIEDVSIATAKYFYFEKPTGTILTRDGQFTTDGTDGYIQYTIASGELNEVGLWSVQCHVITPSGSWRTNIPEFRVERNLDS
jgi:hypothetical protein